MSQWGPWKMLQGSEGDSRAPEVMQFWRSAPLISGEGKVCVPGFHDGELGDGRGEGSRSASSWASRSLSFSSYASFLCLHLSIDRQQFFLSVSDVFLFLQFQKAIEHSTVCFHEFSSKIFHSKSLPGGQYLDRAG